MKRTLFGALALGAIGFLFAAPAQAAPGFGTQVQNTGGVNPVICRTWLIDTNPGGARPYPYDDQHMWVCDPAPIANNVSLVGGKYQNPVIQGQGVNVYLFQTRDAMNQFWAWKYGAAAGVFQSTTARCGQTGYNYLAGPLGDINSAVFETCSYTVSGLPSSEVNTSLSKTGAHEAYHSYDFAWIKGQVPFQHKGPSESKAFKAVVDYDLGKVTPCNWSAAGCTPQKPVMSLAQKVNYVCTMFQIVLPSNLERDLLVPNDKVCNNSTTVNAPYTLTNATGTEPKLPRTILQTRLPYFINSTPYQEIFAERLSLLFITGVSGLNLPVTDAVLDGTAPFTCTYWALRAFRFTNNPPPLAGADSLGAHGCPNPASLDEWKQP